MLFNSYAFLIFLPTVFVGYWFLNKKDLQWQNLFLLLASYIFYGWWDWRFLFLILFSTGVDYYIGWAIDRITDKKKRGRLLLVSLVVNLGLLFLFKYYNFFIESWISIWGALGIKVHPSTLNLILPVGISFYTFQTLSYTVDIYRRKIRPTKDFISFATFVAFFPQLVAGPIERASSLLPQLSKPRVFNFLQAQSGVKLMIWGLFKKVAVADSIAPYVNVVFNDWEYLPAPILLLGCILFAFQIYCDFSGYSDIAIGTARLLGIELMTNFRMPYFSRNISEFWHRWHISLSTWFRDYIYIPLGGSRVNKFRALRNIFVIFLLSGFWHGVNWTFIIWGGIHACMYIPLFLLGQNRKHVNKDIAENSFLPVGRELLQILGTFFIVTFAWIFFRSENLQQAFGIIHILINPANYTRLVHDLFTVRPTELGFFYFDSFVIIATLLIIEWNFRKGDVCIGYKLNTA